MNVLVVNAGSSSLKLSLLGSGDDLLASTELEGWEGDVEAAGLESFVGSHGRIDAVGHRVVHGGLEFQGPTLIDDKVEARIEALTDLAPVHQPRGLAGIRALRRALPHAPAVACFDTAFHATMPAEAVIYALPRQWTRHWSLRRYGFHGLSHAYAARRAAEMLGRPPDELRIVTCHLGAGASLCAVVGGRSVDTTMGFTPVEGLVMATRSGSVDPGLIAWLVDHGRLPPAEVARALEEQSGLSALARGSGDMRAVLRDAQSGDEEATLAVDVYVHRLAREAAGMAAAAGGLDVLLFTGGVGEHSPPIRAAAATRLAFLGVAVDADANDSVSGDVDITAGDAPVRTFVVTAREDLEIARQVRRLLTR